jgi:hypothetical protein
MTSREQQFLRLVLEQGLRWRKGELTGRRPAEIADELQLDRAAALRLCSEWYAKGWYLAEDGFLLHGFVTSAGRRNLRKQLPPDDSATAAR